MDSSKVENAVRVALTGNDASHDWSHVERVVRNAKKIASLEGIVEPELLSIIEIGALLHDIADYKYTGSLTSGSEVAKRVMCETVSGTRVFNSAPSMD